MAQSLLEKLSQIPLFDAHTHLVPGKLGAAGLHDILLYHMSISDLYAAGCPDGARLTQYPGYPSDKEAQERITRAIPHLPACQNTSIQWGLRIILKDLYDWDQPITLSNWKTLDEKIRCRAEDRSWHREILRRAGIRTACTELARRKTDADDDLLHYALEWAFFTRCQWGEYDTALYELERCWGKTPDSPMPIGAGARPATEKTIRTLDDVRQAVDWYVKQLPANQIKSTATHISMDIDYTPVTDAQMNAALQRRASAGPAERDIYASYVNELFLTALEKIHGDKIVYQFSFGAEPLPFETASRMSQRTIAQLAEIIARHPRVQFQCFLSSAHANQSLCTLCRELPNLSLAGYWWHNFFPSIIERIIAERLDMIPVNRIVGFFTDAYIVEWAYAKANMVRRILAKVLQDKINLGQYTPNQALDIAREILWKTAPQILHIPITEE